MFHEMKHGASCGRAVAQHLSNIIVGHSLKQLSFQMYVDCHISFVSYCSPPVKVLTPDVLRTSIQKAELLGDGHQTPRHQASGGPK